MLNKQQLSKLKLSQILRYFYLLTWHYILVIYVKIFNVKKKEEHLIDENTIFFEKWNTKLKNALKNPAKKWL